MDAPLNAVGQRFRDFQITKYLRLDELQSTLIELVHLPSGAQVLQIANDDPENLFSLSFQTLPTSSNGIAHVLEHMVLCGSKKFPVKDPFFSMTRRSLNTYMNALTGQDFTCYVASSQIPKDFYHLLEVYLDAVFYPELKPISFLQEGHRLEFADPKDANSPLHFGGVIYNEMNGSLSSGDSRLWEALHKYLTPDLPYAFNSGGDPKEIPLLTYEELLAFHRNFYQPSRCLFFFYGNLPLTKHLEHIEKYALRGAKKLAPLPPLPLQKRFTSPLIVTERYPITEEETARRDIITFSWLTAPLYNQEEVLALCLLDSILMDTDASPLRYALLHSHLCTTANSAIDVEMSEVPWTLICKGCDAKDADKLKEIIFQTLRELAKSPFSKEQLEASLHQLEFHRKEISSGAVPFGLTLFIRAALIKQHGSEAENALLIHSLFSELRERLKDPQYLSRLIHKHFIDNPHFLLLTLKADPHLEKEEHADERKRLDAIEKTPEKIAEILRQTEELEAHLEAIEGQSLECLPKLNLRDDVPPHALDIPLAESMVGQMQTFFHPCFTNQIVYADLLLDLPELSPSDLPLLSLFTYFLTEVGVGGRSYRETLNYHQAYIGGISANLSLHVSAQDPDVCRPAFSLKGKALFHNAEKLFTLFSDMIFSPDFRDEERLRELLEQHATSLQNRLVKGAMNYAVQTALSGFSTASFIHDQWHGLAYYNQLRKWAHSYPQTLAADLQRLSKDLSKQKATLVLGCEEAHFDAFKKRHFFGLGTQFPKESRSLWKGDYAPVAASSQARLLASPVAFTAYGMRTAALRDPAAPLLLLATELFEHTHLHREIREKGGAYGSGASYAPSTGNFYLYAYRDPHLARTVAAFHKSMEKVAHRNFSERELEEAKFGIFQSLDHPISPAAKAMVGYSWKRAERSLEEREAFRLRILEATREEVASAVQDHLLPKEQVLVTFLDEELFNEEKGKLQQTLPLLAIEG